MGKSVRNMKFSPFLCPILAVAASEQRCPSIDCPCPSSTCWEFNQETYSCHLTEDCGAKLKCGAESIHVEFPKELFGEVNGADNITPAIKKTDAGYEIDCPLGECGMTHTIEDDNLVFDLVLSRVNVKPVHSDSSLELTEDITVLTGGSGVTVTFECIYPTTFSILSDPYDVIKVDISGKMSAYGNLNDGFSMTLSGGTDGTPVKLGQLQQVKATWSVTSLPDVNFFFQSCSISHDDKNVKVINDSCYASVLDAGHLSSEPSHSSFIYRTFSLEDSATTTQTITCILKLCMDGFPCKRAAVDTDCPTGDGNENFLYTLSGVEYGPDDNRL